MSTPRKTKTATIALDGTVSTVVNLGGDALVAIHMPTDWTAADLTFQASEDNVTYDVLYDADGEIVTFTVGADRFIRLNPADWIGAHFLKLVSSQQQAAARVFTLVTRKFE